MRKIALDSRIEHFLLEHVYREFNADADALANVALDQRVVNNPVAVDDNWSFSPAGWWNLACLLA